MITSSCGLLLLSLLSASPDSARAESPDSARSGEAILKAVDAANEVGAHFAFQMRVESFRGEVLKEANEITGYTHYEKDPAIPVRNIIHFTAPKAVSGRKMLIEGSYIWALFPKTRNLIRLTPLQILLGEVAYGDVLRIVYSRDYDLNTVTDSAAEGRVIRTLGLSLKPAHKGENYPGIALQIDSASNRLLHARIFGSGGKLIKTVDYDTPKPFLGRSINTRIRITDGLKPDHYSVMQYLRMGEAKLPEAYFSKDMLDRARIYPF